MFTKKITLLPAFVNTIQEDLRYYGYWWTPNNPEDRVSGTLTVSKRGGIRLILIGMFPSDTGEKMGFNLANHSFIHGQILPGQAPVTLITCQEFQRDSSFLSDTISTAMQRFSVTAMLESENIQDADKSVFSGFEFGTTYLDEWINLSQFDVNFKDDLATISQLAHQVFAAKGDGFEITFNSYSKVNVFDPPRSIQQTSVQINLTKEMSLQEFEETYYNPLVDMIQFCASVLNTRTFTNILPAGGKDWRKVMIADSQERITKASEPVTRYSLLPFKDISGKIQDFVINWLAIHKQYEHVFRLYFDSLLTTHQFPTMRFLTVIQALESYHSEREEDDSIELKLRLHSLFGEAKFVEDELCLDIDMFVVKVRDTRNYYTHYNSKKKPRAVTGLELTHMTYVLRIYLNFHILLLSGLSEDDAQTRVKSHYLISQTKNVVQQAGFWQRT